jgi:hypothetical protein
MQFLFPEIDLLQRGLSRGAQLHIVGWLVIPATIKPVGNENIPELN